MAPRVGSRVAIAAFAMCVACATTSPAKREVGLDVRELYPLAEGNAWSYDVDAAEGSTTLATTRVDRVEAGVAMVTTGEVTTRYRVSGDGIRVESEDGWLLRAPLRPGASWPARGGRTAEIVALGTQARTSAGTFERCVEVHEHGGQLRLEIRTVYCPGVGPVLVVSTMRSDVSDRVLTVSARLRGFRVSPGPVGPPDPARDR